MSEASNISAKSSTGEKLILASSGFRGWLLENECSLALTAFRQNRLIFLGLTEQGQLWAHERHVDGCRGLWIDHEQIWVTTAYQLWNFRNILPEGTAFTDNNSDRLYCPRLSLVTGDVQAHETALDHKGSLIFVNTAYSCLATPDIHHSFTPTWRPPFISSLAPEDRCHLNGLAMDDGVPKYVSAFGRFDNARGWKPHQASGGLVISVTDNEIVSDQLSMPHSPRCHEGKLWLLNTGTCEFGSLDPATGTFEPICHCPGFARGLSFINNYAVVGLSHIHEAKKSLPTPVGSTLKNRSITPMCGILIIDLTRGEVAHWARFEHTITDVSDLSIVPGVRQASMIGFENRDRVAGMISLDEAAVARA